MKKEELKNLILNEPTEDEIENLIDTKENSGGYIKFLLIEDNNENEENNVVVVDLKSKPNVIYAFQNDEEVIKAEIKDNVGKNWKKLAEEANTTLTSIIIK